MGVCWREFEGLVSATLNLSAEYDLGAKVFRERIEMSNLAAFYDKKALIKGLLGIIVVCVCMKLAGGLGSLLVFPILLGALSRNRQEWVFYSLLLITCLTVTNSNIAPKDFVFTIVARVVYLFLAVVMTLQLTAQRSSRLLRPLLWLLFYRCTPFCKIRVDFYLILDL